MASEPKIVRLPSSSSASASTTASSSSTSSMLNNGGSGIDPEVFAALPPEIQQEILDATSTTSTTTSSSSDTITTTTTTTTMDDSSMEIASASSPSSASVWTCHVCTFVNHPDLLQCEICETPAAHVLLPESIPEEYEQEETRTNSNKGPSGLTELYSKLSLHTSSARKALIARTNAKRSTTSSTVEGSGEDLSADDLLLAASAKLTQLQSTATQKLQKAKQNLIKIRTVHSHRNNSMATMALPSKEACLELAALQRDLNQKCKAGDQVFEALLERLWHAIYRDGPSTCSFEKKTMARESSGWIDIGFQRENPDTDFRGGGLLALKCLVYAIEAHPVKMHEIFQAQRPSKEKKWYPVCVAGINLTCIMAGILKLGNGMYENVEDCHWKLFEEPSAFYELFFFAFVKMDAAWRRMNASYMEFGSVLKATRNMVIYMLQQGPETIKDLRETFERTFVDRFVVSLTGDFLADTENGECPDPYHVLEDESEVLLPAISTHPLPPPSPAAQVTPAATTTAAALDPKIPVHVKS